MMPFLDISSPDTEVREIMKGLKEGVGLAKADSSQLYLASELPRDSPEHHLGVALN